MEAAMKTRPILTAALAGLLAAGSIAAGVPAAESGQSGERDDAAEIAAMTAARTSLADAIRLAEAETGGRAFKAGMESDGEKSQYEIATMAGDTLSETTIDAASGKVIGSSREGFFAKLLRDDDDTARLDMARTGLLDAVTAAEQTAGGKAIEAGMTERATAPVYAVDVFPGTGAGLVRVKIDAVSGKVLGTGPADGQKGEGGEGDGGADKD
jgi:uncharacterized membrane protein YkoI